MKLIIDRAKWARGNYVNGDGKSMTRLLDQFGKMCCLGFYGLACGIPANELRGAGEPFEVKTKLWPLSCLKYIPEGDNGVEENWAQSWWTANAIKINDDESLSDADREAGLVKHFAKVGVEVEFA